MAQQWSTRKLLHAAGCEFEPRQLTAVRAADVHPFTLYGGSRGPGKSYWLRWYLVSLHLRWAGQGITNVRSMLACEDYPSLYDRQIVKIQAEFPAGLGYWYGSAKEYRFVPQLGGGAICLRNLDDPTRYQSAEFAAIAVDELTRHKSRRTLDVLKASLRWPGLERCPFVAASNPTGEGASWVRGLFLEHDLPDEYKAAGLTPADFAFVPGLPGDNRHLGPSYWQMLRSLPPVLRKAWEEGDWYTGIEGAIYPDWSSAAGGNVTEDADWRADYGPVEWWLDDGFAAEHPAVVLAVQCEPNGNLNVFHEIVESYMQHDALIEKACDAGYPLPEICRVPSEAGRLRDMLHRAQLRTAMSTHTIEQGVQVVRALICDGAGHRRLRVHPRCRITIQSIAALPEDPQRSGRPLKVNGTPGDHPADAVRYGCWWRKA